MNGFSAWDIAGAVVWTVLGVAWFLMLWDLRHNRKNLLVAAVISLPWPFICALQIARLAGAHA